MRFLLWPYRQWMKLLDEWAKDVEDGGQYDPHIHR